MTTPPPPGTVPLSNEVRLITFQGIKIIVTGGHPGDPEYGCGGTVARLTRRTLIGNRAKMEAAAPMAHFPAAPMEPNSS